MIAAVAKQESYDRVVYFYVEIYYFLVGQLLFSTLMHSLHTTDTYPPVVWLLGKGERG